MKIYSPNVKIFDDDSDVDKYASSFVINQVGSKPYSVITLPTGSTPLGMYTLLSDAYSEGKISFRFSIFFNLDEYWPIKKSSPSSYYYYMNTNFFNKIDSPCSNRFIPNGEANDPNLESEKYNNLLDKYGESDLTVLGIGPGKTAHIGFNEVGSDYNSKTRYVLLSQETYNTNLKFFNKKEDMPIGAITQGISNILNSKKIILIAKGANKAWGINRVINGHIGTDAPASFLRYHPDVTFILDKDASEML